MGRTIIELEDIYKRFYIGTPNELEVLHGISLHVTEGEFVAIVGASGSGKSTLMNIIGALDRPTEGKYALDGVDMIAAKDAELSKIRNRKIGFVFQTYNLISKTNAIKNVEMPMLYAGIPGKQRIARAKELLQLVGMEERMKHLPEELSGGQKIRRSFLRTNRPVLWILRPDVWSWIFFTNCMRRRARPSSSLPIHRNWQRRLSVSLRSRMEMSLERGRGRQDDDDLRKYPSGTF